MNTEPISSTFRSLIILVTFSIPFVLFFSCKKKETENTTQGIQKTSSLDTKKETIIAKSLSSTVFSIISKNDENVTSDDVGFLLKFGNMLEIY